jgi:hypothetical protein
MASLPDVASALLPFLTPTDFNSLALALPALSKGRSAHAGAHMAVCPPRGGSVGWHAAITRLLGKEEYAAIVAACEGAPEPYVLAEASRQAAEAAVCAVMTK